MHPLVDSAGSGQLEKGIVSGLLLVKDFVSTEEETQLMEVRGKNTTLRKQSLVCPITPHHLLSVLLRAAWLILLLSVSPQPALERGEAPPGAALRV